MDSEEKAELLSKNPDCEVYENDFNDRNTTAIKCDSFTTNKGQPIFNDETIE